MIKVSFLGSLIPFQGNEIFSQKPGPTKIFPINAQKYGTIFHHKIVKGFWKDWLEIDRRINAVIASLLDKQT